MIGENEARAQGRWRATASNFDTQEEKQSPAQSHLAKGRNWPIQPDGDDLKRGDNREEEKQRHHY